MLKTYNTESGNALTIIGQDAADPKLFGGISYPPLHTSAISSGFPGAGIKNLAGTGYGKFFWFGSCQQVTNATLLSSGVSSTMAQISPQWSTFATTALYGNYGGGLPLRFYTGGQAYNDYE